jgi:lipoprotein-releasing system ATP-binding protein
MPDAPFDYFEVGNMKTVNKVLSARNLRKSYSSPHEVRVLEDVSLDLEAGESLAIMGKSGEGKSTLLHILGTLETPCSGSLHINGVDAIYKACHSLRNQHIGFIFQSFNLLEDYTVLENTLMPARIARDSISASSPMHKRALQLLDEVGLLERADFPAKLLSGGEKQRAAIARALLNDPLLLLADEPSGNLDAANSEKIHQILIDSCRKKGKALVIVTHDTHLAALMDRQLELRQGHLHAGA